MILNNKVLRGYCPYPYTSGRHSGREGLRTQPFAIGMPESRLQGRIELAILGTRYPLPAGMTAFVYNDMGIPTTLQDSISLTAITRYKAMFF